MIERFKNFNFSGFKTILVAILSLVSVVASRYGFDFPIEDQTIIVTSIMSTLMIVLRLVTKTPVGVSSEK
jgi:hypothetical protein